jgi:hypothetical protein
MIKYFISGIALVNGAWMLIDGIFVIINGKFIGPEKPGPWASLLGLTGVDVFKLGPVFVLFGLAWLLFVTALITEQEWARTFGIVLSILTLWYLPFGTLIALVVLGLMIFVNR